MADLLPKMIVRKQTKTEAPVMKIDKENLQENIVFDTKSTPKKEEEQEQPEEHKEEQEEVEEEIKALENEIEELERPPTPPPTPEPEPEEPTPIVQTIKGNKKVDKRKGCSEARKEHLARIREKALIARRKKAEERKQAKEEASQPQPKPQPIYQHNISAVEI